MHGDAHPAKLAIHDRREHVIAQLAESSALFGNFEGATRTTADPDAPALRIVGSAIFGSVVVRTVPPLRVQKLAVQLRTRRLLPP